MIEERCKSCKYEDIAPGEAPCCTCGDTVIICIPRGVR